MRVRPEPVESSREFPFLTDSEMMDLATAALIASPLDSFRS
jgi:hypothetical protein